MLVLSRKRNESIVIDDNIVITLVEVRGDKIRLGIEAPREVPIHRSEVHAAIQRERAAACDSETKCTEVDFQDESISDAGEIPAEIRQSIEDEFQVELRRIRGWNASAYTARDFQLSVAACQYEAISDKEIEQVCHDVANAILTEGGKSTCLALASPPR